MLLELIGRLDLRDLAVPLSADRLNALQAGIGNVTARDFGLLSIGGRDLVRCSVIVIGLLHIHLVIDGPVGLEDRVPGVSQFEIRFILEDVARAVRVTLALMQHVDGHALLLVPVRHVEAVIQGLFPAGKHVDFLLLFPIGLDPQHPAAHINELKVRAANRVCETLRSFLLRSLLVVVAFEVV